uniref:Lipid scramblase CLPTM1L n=1 Tax=Hippocampus comes TaxID=109280 RepID=A0A3Q2XWJ7_HIPCM
FGGKRSSMAKLLLGVFMVYMVHTAWLLYGFLNTKSCDEGRREDCITSYLSARPRLQLSVFTCLVPDNSQLNLALRIDPFDPRSTFERQVNVLLPEETRANGSLYAVVYVHKASVSPLDDSREVHHAWPLYIPSYELGIWSLREGEQSSKLKHPVSHWRPHLSITIMSEDFTFTKGGLPSDMHRYVRISQEGRRILYLPLMLIDELSFRIRDLMEINRSTTHLPLTVSYEGISLRKFRFWVHLQDVVYSLRQFGFSEEYIDEIKGTLVGSNLYLLVLTAVITALQLICEFLALKNDISSWRKKKSMAGMSRKSVLWRSLCTLLIFLHLLEETSLLVLLPVGLANRHRRLSVKVNKLDEEERRTVAFDTQAWQLWRMWGNCIYSNICCVAPTQNSSCLTGVYAFGFLSMAPQLFINHKVSPAVQPLTAFLSSHQLPFFRDELFFLVYLYQKR